jgi:hypothetical protein
VRAPLASKSWEHVFVTSQGSPYARFRRALDGGNTTIALAAAADLDYVGLSDALELVLLLVDDPGRFRRAALRWHARYCAEVSDVGFEEAQVVLACLAGLAGRQPKAAAEALAALVHRRGSIGERAPNLLCMDPSLDSRHTLLRSSPACGS